MSVPAGPVPDAQGRPLDQIRLLGLVAHGRHGVFEHERRDGQDFRVDVVLHLDTRPAAATDDLTATVHYGDLATAVADIVRGEPVDLIETLAERIADLCLADARVVVADVAVHKPQAPVTEPFGDVVLAVRRYAADRGSAGAALGAVPARPVRAVLALGSNAGDRVGILRAAVAALGGDGPGADPAVRLRAVSGVVETDPVGGPDQDDYLNAVAVVETDLSPRGLLAVCHAIEAAHGRERTVRWGPRTLDVDLVTYGDLVAAAPDLVVPHPRAAVRAFVLAPWLLADPAAELPGPAGPRRVADLLAAAPDAAGVRPRPELDLRGATA